MKLLITLTLLTAALDYVEPHGYMAQPLARTSIHTMPNEPYRPPYYYDHEGVWCSNIQQQPSINQCGRCGGPVGDNQLNRGGAYDKGVIAGNYTSGSVIEVIVSLSAAHRGYYAVELCSAAAETDNCFTKVSIVGGSESVRDNRICVPQNGSARVTARVQLPSGVRCSICTLRWTYRTSYPPEPDQCYNCT